MITSRSVLLIIRDKMHNICRENATTQFTFNKFFSENPAVYEIMWKKCKSDHRLQYNKAHAL